MTTPDLTAPMSGGATVSDDDMDLVDALGNSAPGKPTYVGVNDIKSVSAQVALPSKTGMVEYYWADTCIRKVPSPYFFGVTTPLILDMGQLMLVMACVGPIEKLGNLVAALSLQIRDSQLEPIFKAERSAKELSEKDEIGKFTQPATIKEIASLVLAGHRNKSGLNPATLGKNEEDSDEQFLQDMMKGEAFFSRYPNLDRDDWEELVIFLSFSVAAGDKAMAAFYPFLAGMLLRSCVKSREAMERCVAAATEKFQGLICGLHEEMRLPPMRPLAFDCLARHFKPQGTPLKKVLKVYLLTKWYTPNLDKDVEGILDFLILIHCSYNGLQTVSLAITACDILGAKGIEEIRSKLDVEESRASWAAVLTFLNYYSGPKSPGYPGKLAPWCRLFDNQFWCKLALRNHSLLGHILLGVCEVQNSGIWELKGLPINPQYQAAVQAAMLFMRETDTITKFSKGDKTSVFIQANNRIKTALKDIGKGPVQAESALPPAGMPTTQPRLISSRALASRATTSKQEDPDPEEDVEIDL